MILKSQWLIVKNQKPNMKKTILILSLVATVASVCVAQHTAKAKEIKQRVVKAFGGKKALQSIKTFAYTLNGQKVVIDFDKRLLKKELTRSKTQFYENGKAWEIAIGEKKMLSKAKAARLGNTFFYNFLCMLTNDRIQWKFIKSTIYAKQAVDIVRISDVKHSLDLFVARNGEILTSASPKEDGTYDSYADELEYVTLNKGVRFPLVFRIMRNGKASYEGRFENVKIE